MGRRWVAIAYPIKLRKMSKQASEWIGVNEAANLVGKSLSTIRRLIPGMEKAGQVRREPETGKVLFARDHLVEKFGIEDEKSEPAASGPNVLSIVEILERQIVAKDRQIENLQRDGESKSRQMEEAQLQMAHLTESLKQFAALNASLQSKILTIGERAEPVADVPTGTPRLSPIVVAVAVSLIVSLLVYIFFQW